MVKRYTNKQRSSAPLEDRSVHLIPYMGVTNPAMIRSSKQGQRLEEGILYIPIGETQKGGTRTQSLKILLSYYSLIAS